MVGGRAIVNSLAAINLRLLLLGQFIRLIKDPYIILFYIYMVTGMPCWLSDKPVTL